MEANKAEVFRNNYHGLVLQLDVECVVRMSTNYLLGYNICHTSRKKRLVILGVKEICH